MKDNVLRFFVIWVVLQLISAGVFKEYTNHNQLPCHKQEVSMNLFLGIIDPIRILTIPEPTVCIEDLKI